MTDSFAARGNTFPAGAGLDWNDSSFEPGSSTNNQMAAANTQSNYGSRHLDVRESLEWLLGSAPEPEELDMAPEEKSARRDRRMDLLLWILNLEPRLAPYDE